jgi:outer membrane murein-binding lipoprotein Lpp
MIINFIPQAGGAMQKTIITLVVIASCAVAGCSSKAGTAGLGAIGGAAAGGGAYEYRLHREMQRIEDDYKAKKIDQKEYEIRKDEIQRMQLIK